MNNNDKKWIEVNNKFKLVDWVQLYFIYFLNVVSGLWKKHKNFCKQLIFLTSLVWWLIKLIDSL